LWAQVEDFDDDEVIRRQVKLKVVIGERGVYVIFLARRHSGACKVEQKTFLQNIE